MYCDIKDVHILYIVLRKNTSKIKYQSYTLWKEVLIRS